MSEHETMGLPARGSVAGFEVRSLLSFRYLRDGGGEQLDVHEGELAPPHDDVEPLLRWRPREGNPFEASLYAADGGYLMWIPGLGGFGIAPDRGSITVPAGVDPIRREARLWGVPTALVAAMRGDLPVHAAAVEVDGRALLLCGPSRFGKTTLAAAFLRAGHRMLSEDLTRCRGGSDPVAFPGPSMLRVRRDVYEQLGPFPSTSVISEEADRFHLVLEDDARGSGDPIPLAGSVILRRGTPTIELHDVVPERFLPELFTMSFGLPTDADRARSFGAVVDLASSAPMWLLDRPLRFELLDETVERLLERCFA
jgi:hypothetical protein